MNIELNEHNPLKEFFHKLRSKAENLMFSIVLKLPESMIPKFVMDWLEHYLDKRNSELQQQIVKQNWTNASLEQALDRIHKQE